jgi:glutamine amidotransferase
MIAIIDYGIGNLRSVQKAFERQNIKAVITQNADEIRQADKIILPGVGAMKPAMDKLNELKLIDVIIEAAKKKPFLGICLGLQLLFEESKEGGQIKGLGLLKGKVELFQKLKVPQIGWNQLNIIKKESPILQGIDEGSNVYFCHSYYVVPEDKSIVITQTKYGLEFASAVQKDNIFGVQFHPEKSQKVGLKILQNFGQL